MSTMLYAVAATIVVLCFIIHGCLFYRRWRQKRRQSARRDDKEKGSSFQNALHRGNVTESIHENSAISITESDPGERSATNSVQLQQEAKSSAKSLLDQDLNERRRSPSIRIKVLPPRVLSRSFSGPIQPFQRPREDIQLNSSSSVKNPAPKEGIAAELADLMSKNAQALCVVGRSDVIKNNPEVCTLPNGESSCYELVACGTEQTGSAPQTNKLSKTTDGDSHRGVPAILETQPSEDDYDCLYDRDKAGHASVTWRTKDSPEPDRLKRRSYSFDQTLGFGNAFNVMSRDFQLQTLAPCRSRSASESNPLPTKSRRTGPNKSVKLPDSPNGTSKGEPVYFTLEPDADNEQRNARRYRTLPPIKSATSSESSSSSKRKFSINTFFSRKNRKAERKNQQTPPSSPSSPQRNTNQQVQSAIYEEPEGALGPDLTVVQSNSSAQETGIKMGDTNNCGEKSNSESSSKSKSSFLKQFPRSWNKNKITTVKLSPKKRQVSDRSEDTNGAYEVLEIPPGGPKPPEGPVYDTLGPDTTPTPAANKSLPLIGKTSSGAPIRQYRPDSARRELPSTPHDYDIIQRGALPLTGAIGRSKSAHPNMRRGSSPAKQTPLSKSCTSYDRLSPLVPDRLRSTDLNPRRGSSPETSRRETDQVYDLLNPETFVRQSSTGSVEYRKPRPKVSPKPQSLRGLPRTSNIEYDLLNSGLLTRHASMSARPKSGPVIRPLLRANSLGKLRKISPEVSPKPSRNLQMDLSKPPKPAVARKPTMSREPSTADPVYFTLEPNTTA